MDSYRCYLCLWWFRFWYWFCYLVLYVLLILQSSWWGRICSFCLVAVNTLWLFLAVPWVGMQWRFMIILTCFSCWHSCLWLPEPLSKNYQLPLRTDKVFSEGLFIVLRSKNMVKIEQMPNSTLWEMDILRIRNSFFNMLCALIILSSVKISVWGLFLLYVNFVYFSVKRLKFVPKWSLTYFQPILAAFYVTIAIVKVKLIPDIYTWAVFLTNQLKEIALVKSNSYFYFLV